jgi:hypothetical protein
MLHVENEFLPVNGFKKHRSLVSLPITKQIYIQSLYIVNDPDNTFVNNKNQPYTLVSGFMVICTVNNTLTSYNSKN